MFDHDSPRVAYNLLSTSSMTSDVTLNFVGPQGQFDTLFRDTMKGERSSHLFAKPHVIFSWLKVLKALNPLYEHEPELPDYEEFCAILEESTKQLLDKAIETPIDNLQMTTQIARDDVAGIRATSAPEHRLSDVHRNECTDHKGTCSKGSKQHCGDEGLCNHNDFNPLSLVDESVCSVCPKPQVRTATETSLVDESTCSVCPKPQALTQASTATETEGVCEGPSSNNRTTNSEGEEGGSVAESEMPLRYLYVTDSEKTRNGHRNDEQHEFLCNAAKTLNMDIRDEIIQQRNQSSRRSEDPLSEWGIDGEKAICGAHPDVFLFGRAFAPGRTDISERQTTHLLLQFTAHAATSRSLLFYLFDRKQRHLTVRAMSAKIRQDPKSFAEFTTKFCSSDFQDKLKMAVASPDGPEAKAVLKDLIPVLTCGGKRTVFGALERRSAAGQILAMARKHGPASNFLTISVDDVNSPGVFRMSFRSKDNLSFPSTCPDELLNAMEYGTKFTDASQSEGDHQETITIPCSWSDLATKATNNPVAVALHYKKVVHDLMTILVGIRPGTTSGANNKTVATQIKDWKRDSVGGIMGTPTAFIGVTETTGRGSLHFHVGMLGHLLLPSPPTL